MLVKAAVYVYSWNLAMALLKKNELLRDHEHLVHLHIGFHGSISAMIGQVRRLTQTTLGSNHTSHGLNFHTMLKMIDAPVSHVSNESTVAVIDCACCNHFQENRVKSYISQSTSKVYFIVVTACRCPTSWGS